ncbi:MAG: hypothetical protein AAB227_05160 [Pseudomonadota bacterium]
MRAIILTLGVWAAALAPANADEEREPVYAQFEVTQSAPPRNREITSFEVAGAPVALIAYGRKARARAVGAVQESDELRRLSGAFDPAARPAIVTFEAKVSF